MNRHFIMSAAAAAFIMLTGCADTTELGSRAIIQAAAIDFSDGMYRVSALMFSSSGSGGYVVDASRENVIKVCGEGTTLSEAIDNVSLTDGKEIYLSETKLLILGSGFEKASVTDALGMLYSEMKCSLNMPVCCADNAEELTELHFTEGITSAEKPLSIIENAERAGISPKTMLLDVLADSAGGKSVIIPHFSVVDNGSSVTADDSGVTAVLDGARVVSGGYLGKYYDSRETLGLMLLSGKSSEITLNYLYNGTERTCTAYNIRIEKGEGGMNVSSGFRRRNGGRLPEEERQAALAVLSDMIQSAL